MNLLTESLYRMQPNAFVAALVLSGEAIKIVTIAALIAAR
jgi:hypothetical protein